MGAEVLAVEAGFVAIDEVEGTRIGGEGAESHGGQETGVEHGGAVFVVFGDELAVHGVALDVPDALLAPAGYGHGVDEGFFEGGGGTELIVESGDEVQESLGFLAAEKDVGGKNAVFDGVAGGGGFAGGRDRSAGSASVGAGSGDLKRSTHLGDFVIARVGRGFGGIEGICVDFTGNINIFGVNRRHP
jgi:hypothetical protein